MDAVQVRDVFKFYKKYADRHKFLTIKSALVNKTLFGELQVGERFEALRGVSFERAIGPDAGHHRRERLGQEHPAEDPGRHQQAHLRRGGHPGAASRR